MLVPIHMTGDELLAQGPTAIACLLKEFRRSVTADVVASVDEFLSQLHRLEVGPENTRIQRASRTVCFEDFLEALLQAPSALGRMWPPAPVADALSVPIA